MEDTASARGSVNARAAHTPSVCARMALTASALMNVDLPDALEPVNNVWRRNTALFATGVSRSGWYSSSQTSAISEVNSGVHRRGRLSRNESAAMASSVSPSSMHRRSSAACSRCITRTARS